MCAAQLTMEVLQYNWAVGRLGRKQGCSIYLARCGLSAHVACEEDVALLAVTCGDDERAGSIVKGVVAAGLCLQVVPEVLGCCCQGCEEADGIVEDVTVAVATHSAALRIMGRCVSEGDTIAAVEACTQHSCAQPYD